MKTFVAGIGMLLVAAVALAEPHPTSGRQAGIVAGAMESKAQPDPRSAAQPALPRRPLTPNPVLQATLQNIQNLRSDFATLARLTNVLSITTEKQGLTNDLSMAALGKEPPRQSISKLADDLAAAIVGNNKLRPQHLRLAEYVHAVFNSSHLSALQQDSVFDNVQTILTGGGVAPDVVTNVVNDIKAVATETK
jgi:hypothetical protein